MREKRRTPCQEGGCREFLEGDPRSEAQGGGGKGRDMEAKLGSRQCCQTGTGAIVIEIGIVLVDRMLVREC